MGSYDGLPISDAHRKALEARDKFYEDHPEEVTKLPEKLRSAPSLGSCLAHYAEAESLYAAGMAAWAAGQDGIGSIYMHWAADETHAGHACIDKIIHENPFE